MRNGNQAKQKKFRNRIISYETKAARAFNFNPLNWRRHGDDQRAALRTMLGDVGWVDAVLENKRTGNLIDGHARIEEALRDDPAQLVPYLVVDLTPAEERAVLATLDPIGAMAEIDAEALAVLYQETIAGMPGLEELLKLLHFGEVANGDEQLGQELATIERAAELSKKWKVKRGQIWQLGAHRLMCGDSTIPADAAALMQGQRAELMFTDPPYGVDYTGGHFHSGDVRIKRERRRSAGDTSTDLYGAFLPVAIPHLDGPGYLWFADRQARAVYNAVEAAGEIHALLIWHKTNAKYAALNAQYKQRHEPCLYFKPKGATLRWAGPTDECTVWEIARDAANEWHPTQKPIALAARAIGNHAAALVVDWFAGSGSTLAAAEQLERTCYAMEIDPGYCAVILERLSLAFPELTIVKT